MSLFGDSKAKSISKDAQKKYHPNDGNVHVLMFRTYGKAITGGATQFDDKYTSQFDIILDDLYANGYELVDVKFDTYLTDKDAVCYSTMVMYK